VHFERDRQIYRRLFRDGFALRAALEGLATGMGAANLQSGKVPEVAAHGMRGLHGTLAVERGATTRVEMNGIEPWPPECDFLD
jgi:hypothetical protein